jgi:hypothetical protein
MGRQELRRSATLSANGLLTRPSETGRKTPRETGDTHRVDGLLSETRQNARDEEHGRRTAHNPETLDSAGETAPACGADKRPAAAEQIICAPPPPASIGQLGANNRRYGHCASSRYAPGLTVRIVADDSGTRDQPVRHGWVTGVASSAGVTVRCLVAAGRDRGRERRTARWRCRAGR